jgi:uncharacterized protein YbaA (DUF1428 family)
MSYFEGFIVAVPEENREAYRKQAADFAPLFHEFGVRRHVEAWDDDVPEGKQTDFRRSVQASDGEKVVFSWFEYPDRAARDAANQKIMSDPRMQEIGANMPFDGKRMVMGGFGSILDEGSARGGYVDGYVVPVPSNKRDDYLKVATIMSAHFQELGALRVVEAWEDDVPSGQVTDFRRAVQGASDENIVFSFVEWPDKATRDAGWKSMMENDSMQNEPMPFDGKRMIYGGFTPILDSVAKEHVDA